MDIIIQQKDDINEYVYTYGKFVVSGANDKYRLEIGDEKGDQQKDRMWYPNTMQFTTHDEDNDEWTTGNCAKELYGGWWYNNCSLTHINGDMYQAGIKGFSWFLLDQAVSQSKQMVFKPEDFTPLEYSRMKITVY